MDRFLCLLAYRDLTAGRWLTKEDHASQPRHSGQPPTPRLPLIGLHPPPPLTAFSPSQSPFPLRTPNPQPAPMEPACCWTVRPWLLLPWP
ncbi:MAG: hypothetical protein KatS3mg111_2813 [Pirellulaceae bacterium]|nr:MAG: hypothetical protein KatS3mg111_2813 [Pirellulaceae bacterium]